MHKSKEIFDWIYEFDGDNFNIIPNKEIKIPLTFFKLYSVNDFSIDALFNQYIYATHPCEFNDLFDCDADLLEFDQKYTYKFLVEVAGFFNKEEYEEHLSNKGIDNLNDFAKIHFKEFIYRTIGVFSMSGIRDNVLMWSYYNSNKGFSLEFDIAKFLFPFFGPFPVNYQKVLKPVNLAENDIELAALVQSNIKSDIWKHEQEWRLLIKNQTGEHMYSPSFKILKDIGGHNRKFKYPIEAIKSISLGNRFFNPEEIKIINDDELEINLKTQFEYKLQILEFISDNNIDTYLSFKKDLSIIHFVGTKVKRLNCKMFRMIKL